MESQELDFPPHCEVKERPESQMESQALKVLPKLELKEELCAPVIEESPGRNSTVETEIQNLSLKEMTDIMAQGEPVSFVIVGEEEDALEWIQNTIVLDSQNIIEHERDEKMVVVESVSSELTAVKSAEIFKNLDLEKRKRKHSGSFVTHLTPKSIKYSVDRTSEGKCFEIEIEDMKSDSVFPCGMEEDKNRTGEDSSETVSKTMFITEHVSNKNTSELPYEVKVTQDNSLNDCSLKTDYSSFSSFPPSSHAGSVDNFSAHNICASNEIVPIQQQITVAVTPTVVKLADAMHITPLPASTECGTDHQSIKISSPGANVELNECEDVTDNFPKEPKMSEGSHLKESKDSANTGILGTGVIYRCAECDYASSNKHYYKQHVDLVHNTARPFKCPFCDYAGKRGHALREHLIVHSAQRPYSCLHCNATFRKKGHLTNHTKLHAASTASGQTVVSVRPPDRLPAELAGVVNSTEETGIGKLVKIPVSPNRNNTVITVTAEPSGHLTAAVPPQQKNKQSGSCLAKKNQLWCALCDREMPDANSFQAHLKSVHGTDRLFACDSCEYVTANKGAILSHLALHIPTTVGTGIQPTTTTASANSTTLATALFACTHCGFSTPKMSTLVSHAASHITVGEGNAKTVTSKTSLQPPTQLQTSKLICSECGHTADSTEMMHAHLWTHIGNGVDKSKTGDVPQQLKQQKMTSSAPPVTMAEEINTSSTTGLKALPQNAAFKCTECSYISRDASQFVKHMLVHKTKQNQAPKTEAQTGITSQEVTSESSASKNNRTGSSYKVKPITTENTCQNAESSPFVHDASTGRFRCTICGYSCEYQRTIKAHIWKHSGHHQVDYPIFQNGPLSMYEDPVPANQSVSLHRQTNTIQPSAGVTTVHSDNDQRVRPGSESSLTNQPASLVSGSISVSTNPSAGSGSAPLNVKFITVSGSQVLHSSGPLPTGSLKLIPMQTTPATKSSVSSETAGKHVVVHVQGPQSQSGNKQSDNVLLLKTGGTSESVKTEPKKAATREIARDMESKPPAEIQVEMKTSNKSDGQTDTELVGAGTTSVTTKPIMDKDNPVTDVHSVKHCGLTTNAKIMVSAESVASTTSSKQVMPICGADMQHKRVAVHVHTKDDLSEHPVPVLVESRNEASAASTVPAEVSDSGNISNASNPEQLQVSQHSVSSAPVDDSASCLSVSASPLENPVCHGDELQCVVSDVNSRHEETENRDICTELVQETSIASRVQNRRQSKQSASEPSVVVEPLDIPATQCNLTGLRSQQSSPQAHRSFNSSPVFTNTDESQSSLQAHADAKIKTLVETEAGCHCTDIKEASVQKENLMNAVSSNKLSNIHEAEAKSAKSHICVENEGSENVQTSQDSESAVTLLSLLKRGPNFNPACPSIPGQSVHSGTKQEQDSDHVCPNRSPTSSSDRNSLAKETTDMSEDLNSEMESASSGKSRGVGGGICSTLLAVIEQLRERSRSESDAEDKQTQPPAKKRICRRRGRQDSQEEILEVGDSDNIEQLSGKDGVNYRCKLCHYTSPRVPVIRLHMRTHRQKDPFECSLCPMVAESTEMLQDHMIQHCKVRTYACKFCPQSFNHKSTLRAHMRAHNDSDPFLCDLCDFECSNPLDYRAHMQKHAGSTLLSCPHCPALVASQQDLRIHQAGNCPASNPKGNGSGEKMDGNTTEEMTDCETVMNPKCEFPSTDRSQVAEHVAGHTGVSGFRIGAAGEGPLRCALCDFTAVSSRSLKSHMKRHANDQRYVQQPLEQYKCSLCGYVCHHLPSLKSHMWRHASDQNYSYQFTNDVINAAIDYDTRSDPSPQASKSAAATSKEPDEPELLDRVLSAERRIVEGQMSRVGGSEPVCWVTFRCCQCGFETINKAKLNLHMRTHADIINRTLKVGAGLIPEDETVPKTSADTVDSDMNIRIVYGPV